MANIVIKKVISLDYLGKSYEGGYIEFKSISIKGVENVIDEINEIGDDNKKSANLMIKLLKENFIAGEFVDGDKKEAINKEDLEDFDMTSLSKFFSILTGQDGDLKA